MHLIRSVQNRLSVCLSVCLSDVTLETGPPVYSINTPSDGNALWVHVRGGGKPPS